MDVLGDLAPEQANFVNLIILGHRLKTIRAPRGDHPQTQPWKTAPEDGDRAADLHQGLSTVVGTPGVPAYTTMISAGTLPGLRP